jgi:hypothetical protein
MGRDDSGAAGLNSRMRCLMETPHASATDFWYARVCHPERTGEDDQGRMRWRHQQQEWQNHQRHWTWNAWESARQRA